VPTGLRWGNLREGDHFKDAGIGRRIILKWISEKYDGGAYRIYLAQGRGQVRSLVNAVVNFRLP
jgi:hypothetical protein